MEDEREKYLKAYYANEANANKHMSFALLFSAIILLIVWIGYLSGLFTVTSETLLLTNIVIPISAAILVAPMFFIKTSLIEKRGYKYFVLAAFLLVMITLNITMPKHAVIGWAVCIVLTNHYYNIKFGLVVFLSTMVCMLLCLYGGMFLGEFDPNLLTGQLNEKDGMIYNFNLSEAFPDSPNGRFDYLHTLLVNGENRYFKVFAYYYLSRGSLLTILFFVSNALNKRTYNLLVSEIQVGYENSRTKTELKVAKDIQLATLPVEFITSKDIEIQAELKAAKTVGGDFYDYFTLDEDHIAIVIGDVSGKGIPAAMFMMKTITCFKNYISLGKTPAEILKSVNRVIYEGNESSMFVTCFLAIINTKTGEMKFANAGHNPPIIGQKRNYHFLKCNSGFVLGGLEDAFVVDETYTLQHGDSITLYTDGITEAMNEKREQYGENRLLELFNRKEYSCLIELHHDLKDDVSSFVGKAEQSDDMTYLTLKYHGDEYVYEEKVFKASKEDFPKIIDFFSSFSKKRKFDTAFLNNLNIVGDELISNIIKYAYKNEDGEIFIRLLYNINQKVLIITIIDTGEEFNPFSVNNGPLEGDANDIKEGGLGILIVKKLMSEYAYDHINDKNITILKKNF